MAEYQGPHALSSMICSLLLPDLLPVARFQKRLHLLTSPPQRTPSGRVAKLVVVCADGLEQRGLQCIPERCSANAGIRVRSERAWFDISTRADVNKPPACGEAAACGLLIAWKRYIECRRGRPKSLHAARQLQPLVLRQLPALRARLYRDVLHEEEQTAAEPDHLRNEPLISQRVQSIASDCE